MGNGHYYEEELFQLTRGPESLQERCSYVKMPFISVVAEYSLVWFEDVSRWFTVSYFRARLSGSSGKEAWPPEYFCLMLSLKKQLILEHLQDVQEHIREKQRQARFGH